MYCPRGHGEYQDAIESCPECGARLTPEVPNLHPQGDLVTVLHTADPALVPVVESILVGAGIPYAIRGEETLNLFPATGVGLFVDPEAAGVEIQVLAERADEARELLAPHEGLVLPDDADDGDEPEEP